MVKILDLRARLAEKGMSFMVHADAAWGGYFACKAKPRLARMPVAREYYAFSIGLNTWTNSQLNSLRDVEYVSSARSLVD